LRSPTLITFSRLIEQGKNPTRKGPRAASTGKRTIASSTGLRKGKKLVRRKTRPTPEFQREKKESEGKASITMDDGKYSKTDTTFASKG